MQGLICTLIHLSDPHFGDKFVIDGETWWRGWIARMVGLRHWTGLFPHGYQAAGALAIAVRQILRDRRDRGIPAVVVHTGDLTASGGQPEFSVGATFLRHGHYLENGAVAGLRLETEFGQIAFDIPGNHDLWDRRSPKGHAAFTSHYGGKYPRSREITTPAGRVILYGLDSNRSSVWNHRLANGEVARDTIDAVCAELKKAQDPDTVQIICVHHPLALRKRAAPAMLGREVLRLRDREAIVQALRGAGAHFALSGHVHAQHHVGPPRSPLPVFIAGSACQIAARPAFWQLDIFRDGVGFTSFHLPKNRLHFEPARSRCGFLAY